MLWAGDAATDVLGVESVEVSLGKGDVASVGIVCESLDGELEPRLATSRPTPMRAAAVSKPSPTPQIPPGSPRAAPAANVVRAPVDASVPTAPTPITTAWGFSSTAATMPGASGAKASPTLSTAPAPSWAAPAA